MADYKRLFASVAGWIRHPAMVGAFVLLGLASPRADARLPADDGGAIGQAAPLADVRAPTRSAPSAPWLWWIAGSSILLLSLAGSFRYLAIKRRAAYYDPLTGLPNRTLFLLRLERALANASSDRGCAVLWLNLDRFQNLNSSMGHATGDELLLETTARLVASVRSRDTVARLAADEFAVLIEGVKDTDAAVIAANRIQSRIAEPFELSHIEVYTTACVGISVSRGSYMEPDHMLRDASTAMHRSKADGPGGQMIFEPAMHSKSMKILRLETQLRRAIEEEELELHYQPIYQLSGGELIGFEALLRWQHPDRGLLLPGEFLEIAEHTGFIQRIEAWSLPAACRQLRTWLDAYPAAGPLRMNVNLAGRQFVRHDILELVSGALANSSLAPSQLGLEITENTIMDQPRRILEMLEKLRRMDLCLFLDDFGTGHSSLSYLQKFPVNFLKIDRSFVRRADLQPASAEILRTITELGHNLGLEVVAEGVETAGEVELVRRLGCEMAQGYFLAKPLPVAEIEVLLQECGQQEVSRSA